MKQKPKFDIIPEITDDQWQKTKNGINWRNRKKLASAIMDKMQKLSTRMCGRWVTEKEREDMLKLTGVMLPPDANAEDFAFWRDLIEKKWRK